MHRHIVQHFMQRLSFAAQSAAIRVSATYLAPFLRSALSAMPPRHRNVGTPIDTTIPADRNPPGGDIQRPGADQFSLGGGIRILDVDVWILRRGYPPLDAD